MPRWRWFILLLTPLLVLLPPAGDASARQKKVAWTQIDVRAGDDAKRVKKTLRRLLIKASKRAKWGKAKGLKLRARVTKLSWEKREDIARVSVTVVARIEGGKGARSHIRLGGHDSEKRKLERQALRIVANGLVTRLAELARQRGKK
jgi:hypothetical protein